MIKITKENEFVPKRSETKFKPKYIKNIVTIIASEPKIFLKKNLIVVQIDFIKLSFEKFITVKYKVAKKLQTNTTIFVIITQAEKINLSSSEIPLTKLSISA